MKKQIAIVLTTAMLTLTLSTGIALGSDASTNGQTDSNLTTLSNAKDKDEEITVVVDENQNKIEARSDFFEMFDDIIAKIRGFLEKDPVKKSEIMKEEALEDLAKANKLSREGKDKEAQKALNKYSDKIEAALEYLDQIDPNSDNYNVDEAIKLQAALEQVNANNIFVLSNLLDKVPPQAAQKIAINIVRSMQKAIAKMEKTEEDVISSGNEKQKTEDEKAKNNKKAQALEKIKDKVKDQLDNNDVDEEEQPEGTKEKSKENEVKDSKDNGKSEKIAPGQNKVKNQESKPGKNNQQ